MGAFDDLIPSSGGGAFDDLVPTEQSTGILDTIKNYGLSTLTALGQGTGELEAAAGGMLQDPTSGALSMLTGGAALADRGITGLSNWVSPGSAQLSEPIQRTAQDAAAFASERRAANVDEARRKVGDRSSNILDQTALAGAGLEDVGRRLVQENKGFDQTNNPELLRQQKALSGAEGFVGNIKAGYDNPLALSNTLIRSLPAMLAGLGLGRAAATSVLAGAESAAANAAGKAAAAGLDSATQAAAAQAAVKVVQDQAIARASTAGMLSEAGTSSMQGRESTYQQVAGMPLEALAKAPRFQEILAKVNDPLRARQILANEIADQLPLLSGIGTGSGTLITNKLFGMKLLGGKGVASDATAESLAGVNKMTARDLGLRTAQDTVEEGIQGIPEDAAQFGTSVQADPNQKYDFGGSLAQNLMGGLAMGGAGHGFAYGREKYQAYKEGRPTVQEIASNTDATPANTAQKATKSVAPEITPAEKALLTPVALTSLDRVNELDKTAADYRARLTELSDPDKGYGPMFDGERQDITTALQKTEQERTDLTNNWAKPILGNATTVTLPSGAVVAAHWGVIDASEAKPSHDVYGNANPAFDPALQPRDRGSRSALLTQVGSMAAKLSPNLLDESALAGMGAPTMRIDGTTIDGNGRQTAINMVYQSNGQKAADLREYVAGHVANKGISPESIAGIKNPQLGRFIDHTPGFNYAEFAKQANGSAVAQMSSSEQAKSDVSLISSMEDLNPDDNGDFSNAASRPFVQRFMARLPITEQAGMVDANGALSTAGYARVRNAVLAKAYGDSPVLARMTESMDDSLRNVSRAFMLAAPKVAAMRSAIKAGNRFDADITPDLMDASEELARIKTEGGSVAGALAQTDMMGEQRTPEARQLLQFLNDNLRRPRRMADFISAYMDALDAAGDPNQGSLLGDIQAPAKQDLLKAAERATQNEVQNDGPKSGGTTAQTSAQAGRQPANAQGGSSGDQTNAVGQRPQGSANDAGQPGAGWVNFPDNTGTLGIPRARMPQVRSAHRGALINFLEGQGIGNSQGEVAPNELKPTQAEFAPAKVEKYQGATNKAARSVLVSSDGYVLDGHHQWLAHLADNKPVKVIKFDAPITKLLAAVREFPSVGASEGATANNARADNVLDFKNALADLAQIASQHTRVAFIKEDTPNLMPTLVNLMAAGIKEVGYELRDLIKYVKEALKSDARFKTFWNKISNETYKKAAQQAMEATPDSGDLFAQLSSPKQGGLFDALDNAPVKEQAKPAKPKAAVPALSGFANEKDLSKIVNAIDLTASPQEKVRQLAELTKQNIKFVKALTERIDAAFGTKSKDNIKEDANILSKASRPSILAKKPWHQVEHIRDSYRFKTDLDSITQLPGVIKMLEESGIEIIKRDTDKLLTPGEWGWRIVAFDLRMPNGQLVEYYLPVSEMEAAKKGKGHELFEMWRNQKDEDLDMFQVHDKNATMQESRDLYQAAWDSYLSRTGDTDTAIRAALSKVSASARPSSLYPSETNSPMVTDGAGDFQTPSKPRTAENLSPNTNATLEPSESTQATHLSSTFISPSFDASIAQKTKNGYSEPQQQENSDVNDTDGAAGAQGQGTGTAQATGSQGGAESLRGGLGGPDQRGNHPADTKGPGQGELGQAATDGVRGSLENGGSAEPGTGHARSVGVPAGRDIPTKTGLNYEFGPDDLNYAGSWQKKAEQNVKAVELLKKLQTEARQATREEQKVLATFVGWGAGELANNLFGPKLDKAAAALENYAQAIEALGDKPYLANSSYRDYQHAFAVVAYKNPALTWYNTGNINKKMLDDARPDAATRRWLALRERLQAALTPEELAEASRSTQYAHYTSKAVVQSMWRAMERMGFKGGSILEPGAGIGIFPGLMPGAMANNSVYTGIEFDGITGAILKQLFPDERILTESFVDSKLPKNFYDVAAGNPPFSGTKILGDPEYAKLALSLHDYFFAKSIDRVKPGGLVMFVTSRYTMDKLSDKARAYMAERADLVGAIRLPQTAFKQNAGTDVVTDVIFLRKKVAGETFAHGQAWMKTATVSTPEGPALVNEYFAAHPDMVLGAHSMTGKMQNTKEPQYTVLAREGDIEAHFAKAVENLPADIYRAERGSSAEAAKVREIDFNPKAQKEGNYYVSDAGVLMVREGGVGIRADKVQEKDKPMIKAFVPLRDALKQAHYDQLNDGEWEKSLSKLQTAYAAFVKKHGQINQFTTKTVKTTTVDEDTGEKFADEEIRRSYTLLTKLKDDPDHTLVMALENVNDDTGTITEGTFLHERVLGKPAAATISTPTDALLSVLNDVGSVDLPSIAQRLGLTQSEAIEALGSAIYNDPEGVWTTADEYLSGNVKNKLTHARAAAESDKNFERNVAALEAAQPTAKTANQINATLGMNWIPGEVYKQFLMETAGVNARVEWNPRTKQWIVEELGGGSTLLATADWGTGRRNAADLLEHALTGRKIRIETTTGSGATKVTAFDPAATESAQAKLVALRNEFESWLWRDANRSDTLVREFNDKFNTTVPRTFDGSHLQLPGSSKRWHVFDHVKRGAWRIIQRGNTYLAHAVGSGKTFQMVISAMEQKRLGLIKKPMMVVPNHMLQQFAREWQDLYPAARLMVADENNFHTDNRRRFVSRVALSDLDGVIITQSAFKILDLDPVFKQKMIQEQLDYMRAALEEAGGDATALYLSPNGVNKKGETTYKLNGGGKSKDPRIKQIEKQIENMEQKLMAATSGVGKDQNARFDELGVDMLYVDEAHNYRKLDFTTNRQIKGITPAGSGQAFDLYMKARYLEEKTPGRSLVMASGTPVTNTVAELYTVQKFMDLQALIDRGIEDFDSWAAMFGREKTTLESNAAGVYEPVTRFSEFVNVPELTQMFREYADVLNSDHLANLLGDKRPKVEGGSRKIIVTPKTADYAEFQHELEHRVEVSKAWKPSKEEPNNPDPIIKIIGDGRLAAIDMRFIKPSLPSDPDSKLNRLADDVIRTFKETAVFGYADKDGVTEPNKGASMMVFSDIGFGEGVAINRGFNARAWFEKRLRDGGVNMNQVAFMGDHKKSSAKAKLFKDVNAGRIRVLVGSSKNMGTGVNAQQRLKALFHLDSPWYPADLEQREGRIVRQGNKNPLVQLYAYAAKGSFDERMWKTLAGKQFFIDQALSGDPNIREIEDLDGQSQFDIISGMIADDPRVLELAGDRADVEKMLRLSQAHEQQRYNFRQTFNSARADIDWANSRMPDAVKYAGMVKDLSGANFVAKVGKTEYTGRTEWGQALIDVYKDLSSHGETQTQSVGEISGFKVAFSGAIQGGMYMSALALETPERLILASDPNTSIIGMTMRATNTLAGMVTYPAKLRERISAARSKMDSLQGRLEAPFPLAEMLASKIRDVQKLEAELAQGPVAPVESNFWDNFNEDDFAASAGMGLVPPMVLSRGAGSGMDLVALQALAQRIQGKMPNMPKVNVLASPDDLPPSVKTLRDYIEKQGAMGDVEGAMHDGELYLFASGLPNLVRAEHVLAEHEAAHFGLRAMLGDNMNSTMQSIFNNNAAVRLAAAELQKRGKLDEGKLDDIEATEEVIVDIPSSQLIKLNGWRKVVVKVRDWLADHGFENTAAKLSGWLDGKLSDQQRADLFVADLVRGARNVVRSKGQAAAATTGTMLASTLVEDVAKQEKWLATESRSRGYKDIEDLAEKNYPLFEKLAELWRKKNPAENGVLLSRGKNGNMTNQDVVGNQGGRSADDNSTSSFKNSKVVDAKGDLLTVFHGTITAFDKFNPEADPYNYEGDRGKQFFLDSAKGAGEYAIGTSEDHGGNPNIRPVHLNIKNPRIEHTDRSPSEWWDDNGDLAWKLDVIPKGHDGMIIHGDGETMYVTSSPDQIRSIFEKNEPTAPDSGGAMLLRNYMPLVSAQSELDRAINEAGKGLQKAMDDQRGSGRVLLGRSPHVLSMLAGSVLESPRPMIVEPYILNKTVAKPGSVASKDAGKHFSDLEGVSGEDLARAMYRPAAIVDDPSQAGNYNIVTNILTPRGPLVVNVNTNGTSLVNGKTVPVVFVNSIYARELGEVGMWFNGKEYNSDRRIQNSSRSFFYIDQTQIGEAVTGRLNPENKNPAFKGRDLVRALGAVNTSPVVPQTALSPISLTADSITKFGTPANENYRGLATVDAGIQRWLSGKGLKPGVKPAKTYGNLLAWIGKQYKGEDADKPMFSRAPATKTVTERANQIIATKAATAKPLDVVVKAFTKITGIERATRAIYNRAGYLLDKYTPEQIKAGMVSDYGVPEAVIDQRALMQGRQRVQLRQAGSLIDKLSTLTRAESRVAYEWMNETDPHTVYTMMQNLPDESVKVLQEVQGMIDKLSLDAVRMGQLSPDAYERNKFAYLRRSYAKYTLAQTPGEKKSRARTVSILGDQYKGRGITESSSMDQIKNAAPEWWKRKFVSGKADTSLKGEKFIRMERHAPSGERTTPLPGMEGKAQGKLKEVQYFPAGLALPAKYADWTQAGTFEARDTKGGNVILWRDFTKDERENMGEIDEARFAIAKTLHAMIHDVEVGRYLEWLAHTYAKKEGETIPGTVVNASERYADTFKPGEWVKVPDSKIQGTAVLKYGTLAGRYLPGPIWNDLRQTVNGQFNPFGDTYAKILGLWKISKTALSPAVHMNNVMSNFVMADWHDVTAGHTAKALRIILGAHGQDGKGALGAVGNKIAGAVGSNDRAAAKEIMNRYLDSGGNIGSWATNEIAQKQIEPLLAAMEAELAATNGNSVQAQVGVMSALQHALHLRLGDSSAALKGSKPGTLVGTEAKTMIDLYQSEDEVFRLAAWLKAKEEGKTDMQAGKIARVSFMDYNINAPWVQALRNSALPFVSYTYRAVPMMLEMAAKKPHKLMKLMALAGALNALGVLLAGGDDDKDRKLLPEEKAGRIWGMVPKLIRMPWNDKNASPVYLDIRRFIPIGDVLDVGQNHAAIPMLPMMTPGGPLVMLGEVVLNKTGFTGKPITLETDTPLQQTQKVMDYLYKAFMPNIIGLPGTYASTGVFNAAKGKTDAFGREQSVAQAMASSFGVKLSSYPADVLRKNETGRARAMIMEIDRNISGLKRQLQNHSIGNADFQDAVKTEQEKKQKIMLELSKKVGG